MTSAVWRRGFLKALRGPGIALFFSLMFIPAAHAQEITPECETQLALSALPQRLRDEATVYISGQSGFRVAQSGKGKFSCIVERNHPDSIIPQCLDQAGAESILPALIDKSEQILAGIDPQAVADAHAENLATGAYKAPSRPGVSYMASEFNQIWLSASDKQLKVGPHVMFYAPEVTNADIGGSHQEGMQNHGMPFVLDSGPHGYMVTYIDKGSESEGVWAACGEQLAHYGFVQ